MDWHLPNGKGGFSPRRFTTTTRADAAMIEAVAELGLTWTQLKERLCSPSAEATVVIDRFIAEGYGDVPVRTPYRCYKLYTGNGKQAIR